MSDLRLPSSAEVRRVIEAAPEEVVKLQRGNRYIKVDGRAAKYGLMAQYLVAGRSCEVAGKYMLHGKHAIEVRIDKEPAILFAVRTAKQHKKNGWILRPNILPLNPEFEPWTKKVLDYMREFGLEGTPFQLHENVDCSVRYYQRYAKEVFAGMSWLYVGYNRNGYTHPSLGFKFDRAQGIPRKELPEEEFKAFGEKASYDRVKVQEGEKPWVPVSVKVDSHWRDVVTQKLRALRLRDCENTYQFKVEDKNIYAGWYDKKAAAASRHYLEHPELELDIGQDDTLPRTLSQMGRSYFPKLLRPIGNLMDPESVDTGGIEIIG